MGGERKERFLLQFRCLFVGSRYPWLNSAYATVSGEKNRHVPSATTIEAKAATTICKIKRIPWLLSVLVELFSFGPRWKHNLRRLHSLAVHWMHFPRQGRIWLWEKYCRRLAKLNASGARILFPPPFSRCPLHPTKAPKNPIKLILPACSIFRPSADKWIRWTVNESDFSFRPALTSAQPRRHAFIYRSVN